MHLDSSDQKVSRAHVANLMRERLHNDPILTERLIPNYALGCRRMTPGAEYLEALTKDNVNVVTKDAIRFTPEGVLDADGLEHKVDAIVCATGFETLFTPHFTVIGRNSRVLQEEWSELPKGYLSVMAEGYPNLFCKQIVTPPNVFDQLFDPVSFRGTKWSCKS